MKKKNNNPKSISIDRLLYLQNYSFWNKNLSVSISLKKNNNISCAFKAYFPIHMTSCWVCRVLQPLQCFQQRRNFCRCDCQVITAITVFPKHKMPISEGPVQQVLKKRLWQHARQRYVAFTPSNYSGEMLTRQLWMSWPGAQVHVLNGTASDGQLGEENNCPDRNNSSTVTTFDFLLQS